MREEALTHDRSRIRAKARAARIKQANTIMTASGLAVLASALWKPVIEHTGRIEAEGLMTIGLAVILLAVTVAIAPLGDAS